jgi:hypothetical protein
MSRALTVESEFQRPQWCKSNISINQNFVKHFAEKKPFNNPYQVSLPLFSEFELVFCCHLAFKYHTSKFLCVFLLALNIQIIQTSSLSEGPSDGSISHALNSRVPF